MTAGAKRGDGVRQAAGRPMATDGLSLALGRRWQEALARFTEGLAAPQVDALPAVAGVDRTTLWNSWPRTGRLNTAALLRLDAHFAQMDRPGFLSAVLAQPALTLAHWKAAPENLDNLEDPRHRQLIEAARHVGAPPLEALEAAGLTARSHIIMLQDGRAISTHIGSRTLVSPDLKGLDIRDRANASYAGLVHDQVVGSRDRPSLYALHDSQGNRYRALRIPFRASRRSGLVEIVALPFDTQSAANYLVS